LVQINDLLSLVTAWRFELQVAHHLNGMKSPLSLYQLTIGIWFPGFLIRRGKAQLPSPCAHPPAWLFIAKSPSATFSLTSQPILKDSRDLDGIGVPDIVAGA
jgi:hypothetical protein